MSLLKVLSTRYQHSSIQTWRNRIESGQIRINNSLTSKDIDLYHKDIVCWSRPPWIEQSIPCKWETIFDDNDILVINKPSGLPVIPGGGFVNHTLTTLLKLNTKNSCNKLVPKPVHRLGRFTSGVLICARERNTRAKLCKLFNANENKKLHLKRIYRALAKRNSNFQPGETIEIIKPIEKHFHPLLGYIWNTSSEKNETTPIKGLTYKSLKALSKVKFLERREESDLLEVTISTGRPHQIRIHLAAIESPLIGDPLYHERGAISYHATPGEGGFLLHSNKISNIHINKKEYSFEALPPLPLRINSKKNTNLNQE